MLSPIKDGFVLALKGIFCLQLLLLLALFFNSDISQFTTIALSDDYLQLMGLLLLAMWLIFFTLCQAYSKKEDLREKERVLHRYVFLVAVLIFFVIRQRYIGI